MGIHCIMPIQGKPSYLEKRNLKCSENYNFFEEMFKKIQTLKNFRFHIFRLGVFNYAQIFQLSEKFQILKNFWK